VGGLGGIAYDFTPSILTCRGDFMLSADDPDSPRTASGDPPKDTPSPTVALSPEPTELYLLSTVVNY